MLHLPDDTTRIITNNDFMDFCEAHKGDLCHTQFRNLVIKNMHICTICPRYPIYFDNSSFENCLFLNSQFSNCTFTDTVWTHCTIINTGFYHCNFTNAKFTDTVITSSHFNTSILSTIQFPQCSTSPAQLFNNNIIAKNCTINPNNAIILYTLITMFLFVVLPNLQKTDITPLLSIQQHLSTQFHIFAIPPVDPTKQQNIVLRNLLLNYRHPEFLRWLIRNFPDYLLLVPEYTSLTDDISFADTRKLRLNT